MPGKKKKGSKSNAASDSRPPLGGHNDSLRADIAAAQQQQQQHDNPFANDADADDGDDLAAQLLASLDARDEAQAQEQAKEPPPPPPPQEKEQHTSPSKVLSGLKEVGDKILHPSSSSSASSPPPLTLTNDQSQQQPRKIGRQKLRKQRKEAEQAADRARYEEELKANGGNIDEAEVERSRIFSICSSLGVEMHEINPDGHCLYSAISDQYTLLTGQKRTYQDLRRQTSEYMKSNKDDFLPFISDFDEKLAGINNNSSSTDNYIRYCDAIQNTAVWGGQPEILAMSRFLSIPIWIIQADEPTILKINEEQSKEGKLLISYHRKMYGLGEHYNSLRNKSG